MPNRGRRPTPEYPGLAAILILELAIDRHRGPRPFGGGDDDELDVAVRVPRQEKARDAGVLLASRAGLAILTDLAAEHGGQRGTLGLVGIEEQGVALQRRTGLEDNPL